MHATSLGYGGLFYGRSSFVLLRESWLLYSINATQNSIANAVTPNMFVNRAISPFSFGYCSSSNNLRNKSATMGNPRARSRKPEIIINAPTHEIHWVCRGCFCSAVVV
ncbi:hypothetical protein ACSQ67_017882 [Phaseolus vulgaris]